MIKRKLYYSTAYWPKNPDWYLCTYLFGILIRVKYFKQLREDDLFEIVGKQVTIYSLPSNKRH